MVSFRSNKPLLDPIVEPTYRFEFCFRLHSRCAAGQDSRKRGGAGLKPPIILKTMVLCAIRRLPGWAAVHLHLHFLIL